MLRAVGLIGVVIAWLAIAGVGGPAIGSLSTVQSNDQESFLPAGGRIGAAADAAAAFDDSGALPAFVIFETSGGAATPEQLASWQAFTRVAGRRSRSTGRSPALGTIGDYLVAGPGRSAGADPADPVRRTGRRRWSSCRCRRTR